MDIFQYSGICTSQKVLDNGNLLITCRTKSMPFSKIPETESFFLDPKKAAHCIEAVQSLNGKTFPITISGFLYKKRGGDGKFPELKRMVNMVQVEEEDVMNRRDKVDRDFTLDENPF